MINEQSFRLDGRVALVIGSSGGIGLAMARGLAQAGATVVLNGRNAPKLAQAMEELTEALAQDEAFSAWLTAHTPNRRWGEGDDLAGAAVFLASDASCFVNGHILYVDGGMTASL